MSTAFDDGFDLMPPRDRFWADPFLWIRNGRHYVFVEELPFATGRGHISAIEFDEGGCVLDCVIALEKPWHLSYPFLFEWDGSLWMLPEAGESRTLTLYRCEGFPDRWVAEKDLMENLRFADPTLVMHEGIWWLFVNIAGENKSFHDALHLFFADSPLGPFRPHAQNPVRCSAMGSRPAGAPFALAGILYRPAQDCARVYGLRTVIHRIESLTTDNFRESVVGAIEPGWRAEVLRTHTLNTAGPWRVVDALHRIPRRPLRQPLENSNVQP